MPQRLRLGSPLQAFGVSLGFTEMCCGNVLRVSQKCAAVPRRGRKRGRTVHIAELLESHRHLAVHLLHERETTGYEPFDLDTEVIRSSAICKFLPRFRSCCRYRRRRAIAI